jgi:pimeloyl-ACP methyl ester carboxylesterase
MVTRQQDVSQVVLLPAVAKPLSTTTQSTKSGAENQQGFFWDFQGHSCYAEISKPPKANTLTSLLPYGQSSSDKPSVILIHGFGCSTVYWRETVKYLIDAGYTVHALDLLGQGKSAKPGGKDDVSYSISLWAKMMDDYARRYIKTGKSVLVGNSLGSVVCLSAATGDWCNVLGNDDKDPFLPPTTQGLCFYNCGIGMNSRNVLKTVPEGFLRSFLTVVFDVFDRLIFGNKSLLTYLVENKVTKESLRTALLGLYALADDPESRVDDELVNSFVDPVVNDSAENVVEVISQIYLNDAGKTPMELHELYLTKLDSSDDNRESKNSQSPLSELAKSFAGNSKVSSATRQTLPIHLIWGDTDGVTPLKGPVGKFYLDLANQSNGSNLADVSIQVVRAGHIPFDERPECNEGLITWLEQLGQPKMKKVQDETKAFSIPKWPF